MNPDFLLPLRVSICDARILNVKWSVKWRSYPRLHDKLPSVFKEVRNPELLISSIMIYLTHAILFGSSEERAPI